jgi:hypothetical protein
MIEMSFVTLQTSAPPRTLHQLMGLCVQVWSSQFFANCFLSFLVEARDRRLRGLHDGPAMCRLHLHFLCLRACMCMRLVVIGGCGGGENANPCV